MTIRYMGDLFRWLLEHCVTPVDIERARGECQGRCVIVPGAPLPDEEGASPSLDHPEHLLTLVIPFPYSSLPGSHPRSRANQ